MSNEEFNYRHPKAQALLSANARKEIYIRLCETILDSDFNEDDLTALDMEYWDKIHDDLLALRKRCIAAEQERNQLRQRIDVADKVYQYRMYPNWNIPNPLPEFVNCSKEQYLDYVKISVLHDWIYETRILYALPPTADKE